MSAQLLGLWSLSIQVQTIVIVLVKLDYAIVVLSLGGLRDHIVVWVSIVRDESAAVVVAS